jgi:ubiquinone/menaquinone biosynthesis C-methylase UbiE
LDEIKHLPPAAPRVDDRLYGDQKRFFERNPRRLATMVFGNPRYPRTQRKKIGFIADRLQGCERILEIGACVGMQLSFLIGRFGPLLHYAGIDVAVTPLRAARAELPAALRDHVVLSSAAAEALPFGDATFDGVFCIDVLHHVSSQQRALREIRRVLRPGGEVICVEPNPVFPANLVYLRDPLERKLFDLTAANARAWATAAELRELTLTNVPVFFPGFPHALTPVYERCERVLGAIPGLRRLSTARVLMARR